MHPNDGPTPSHDIPPELYADMETVPEPDLEPPPAPDPVPAPGPATTGDDILGIGGCIAEAKENGSIAKVINKGLTSYRDPGSAPGRGQKTLHITAADMDLTKVSANFFQKPYFQKNEFVLFANLLKSFLKQWQFGVIFKGKPRL